MSHMLQFATLYIIPATAGLAQALLTIPPMIFSVWALMFQVGLVTSLVPLAKLFIMQVMVRNTLTLVRKLLSGILFILVVAVLTTRTRVLIWLTVTRRLRLLTLLILPTMAFFVQGLGFT